jgi:hypothetical protein
MPQLSLGRGFGDDHEVSDYVQAAHSGDLAKTTALAQSAGADHALAAYFALRGRQRETFAFVVAKMPTVPVDMFYYVLVEDESFLALLPIDSAALGKARARWASLLLSQKLLEGQLTGKEAAELLTQGADPNRVVNVAAGTRDYSPLQLAARHPNLEVFQALLAAGAHIPAKMPDGTDLCRSIYETQDISAQERKDFHALFLALRLKPSPPLGLLERWRLWRGLPL